MWWSAREGRAPGLFQPCFHPRPAPRSHLIRAGLLHRIQGKLAADELEPAAAGADVNRRTRSLRGVPGAGGGGRHVPLLQRAKEPAVEERLLKLKAARAAAGGGEDEASAAAAGTAADAVLQPA